MFESREDAIYAVDADDGSVYWRNATAGFVALPLGDTLYSAGREGSVVALDAATGEGLWTHAFRRDSYQRPAVAGGTVFATGTNDDALVALDAETGAERWRVQLDVDTPSSPTVASDLVLLQANLPDTENQLHVFDRETGRLEYGFEYHRVQLARPVQPVVTADAAYVVGAEPHTRGASLYEIR